VTRLSRAAKACSRAKRQDTRRDVLRIAAHRIDIRHALGVEIARRIARHDHRQVAPARICGQLLDKVLDRRTIEAIADHHAVDVAGAEIAARRVDGERADETHTFADRDGERRIVAPAADDQHRRIIDRIGLGQVGCVEPLGKLLGAAEHRRVQRAHPQRGAQARNQPRCNCVGGNW
jgi:hypothetical protein